MLHGELPAETSSCHYYQRVWCISGGNPLEDLFPQNMLHSELLPTLVLVTAIRRGRVCGENPLGEPFPQRMMHNGMVLVHHPFFYCCQNAGRCWKSSISLLPTPQTNVEEQPSQILVIENHMWIGSKWVSSTMKPRYNRSPILCEFAYNAIIYCTHNSLIQR